jgi:hypothetical protein
MSIFLENHPDEQRLVGQILTKYGDLEYVLACCLGQVLNNKGAAVRSLFRLRGGNVRIQVADAIMRPFMDSIGLKDHYDSALGALRYSTSIRNQYAHCHWYDCGDAGLFFTDMQKAAATVIGELSYSMRHTDKSLLELQSEYLSYNYTWLWYLTEEYEVRAGRSATHDWPIQKIKDQPPLHNPPAEHHSQGICKTTNRIQKNRF